MLQHSSILSLEHFSITKKILSFRAYTSRVSRFAGSLIIILSASYYVANFS